MSKYSCIALLATLLCVPVVVAEQAAALLIALLEPIDSFSARFEQRVLDRDGSELERSTGHVILARGNRFRWITQTPWPQQLISNGTTLWQYDVDLEQVIERAVDARLQHTPGLLFGGDVAALDAQYEIREQINDDDPVRHFVLIPRSDDGVFASLVVAFDGPNPESMLLVDGFGQRTEIRFSDAVRNTPVEESLFTLQIPTGVDVLSDAR